jgi:hypothetical protein
MFVVSYSLQVRFGRVVWELSMDQTDAQQTRLAKDNRQKGNSAVAGVRFALFSQLAQAPLNIRRRELEWAYFRRNSWKFMVTVRITPSALLFPALS